MSRCIGGVGVFLIVTGLVQAGRDSTVFRTNSIVSLTVSTRMDDDDFSLSLETFKYLTLNVRNLALWLPAFGLAVLLRIITHKFNHQLVFPLCAISSYFYACWFFANVYV